MGSCQVFFHIFCFSLDRQRILSGTLAGKVIRLQTFPTCAVETDGMALDLPIKLFLCLLVQHGHGGHGDILYTSAVAAAEVIVGGSVGIKMIRIISAADFCDFAQRGQER